VIISLLEAIFDLNPVHLDVDTPNSGKKCVEDHQDPAQDAEI